jgi:hypothetical protein
MAIEGSPVMPLQALQASRFYKAILEHIKDLHHLGDITVAQEILEPVRLFTFSSLALGEEVVVASYVKYKTA